MKKNPLIYIICLCLTSFGLAAQETTIYNCPLDFDKTNTKISSVILAIGFSQSSIRTRYLEVTIDGKMVRVMNYEFDDEEITKAIVQCEPTASLDMPFRMVVWEEEDEVFIGYVDTIWLRRRFLIKGCQETLSEYSKILIRIANETIKSD